MANQYEINSPSWISYFTSPYFHPYWVFVYLFYQLLTEGMLKHLTVVLDCLFLQVLLVLFNILSNTVFKMLIYLWLIWPLKSLRQVKNLPAVQETRVWFPGLGRSPGEGNGNRLQCPCLENLMDRGVWWAAVHERVGHDWATNTYLYLLKSFIIIKCSYLSLILPVLKFTFSDINTAISAFLCLVFI